MWCDICNEHIHDFGHNAEPVVKNGKCCDVCNIKVVIPKRIEEMNDDITRNIR